jgi:hypothetical protein
LDTHRANENALFAQQIGSIIATTVDNASFDAPHRLLFIRIGLTFRGFRYKHIHKESPFLVTIDQVGDGPRPKLWSAKSQSSQNILMVNLETSLIWRLPQAFRPFLKHYAYKIGRPVLRDESASVVTYAGQAGSGRRNYPSPATNLSSAFHWTPS